MSKVLWTNLLEVRRSRPGTASMPSRKSEFRAMVEPLLTVKEVKQILKCSLPLVYRLAVDGRLPAVRIPCPGNGNRAKTIVRFKKADVFQFIESNYDPGKKTKY